MGRLIEGLWDCKYCGSTQIGGSKRECPNCGKPRDKDVTFYLPGTKRYVPKDQTDKINRNPDWLCEYCDSLNSDSDSCCVSCGSPRTEKNLNYFENKIKQEEKQQKNSTGSHYSSSDYYSRNESSSKSRNDFSKIHTKSSSFSDILSNVWKPALCIILIALAIYGIFLLFQPKEYELTVTELSWERCINVERYQTVEENSWYLPSNARLLETRLEYSHSEQVLDHYATKTRQVEKQRISGYETYVSGYRDLGNGYFEEITSERPVYETYYETETYQEPVYRSEPVYRTKYYYEIDKWLYERSVSTSGIDSTPYWGKVNLKSDERESSRSDTYEVKGIDLKTDEEISFYLNFEDWSTLRVGQNLYVKISFNQGEILE